jgi:hypothetical protein
MINSKNSPKIAGGLFGFVCGCYSHATNYQCSAGKLNKSNRLTQYQRAQE